MTSRASGSSGAFVLDTHELGRRPGASRTVQWVVAAPAEIGTDVLGIPEGADLRLDLRLEAVMEGVLASGTVEAQLHGECVRCLDRIERQLEIPFQELYVYPNSEATEDEAARLEGDLLDLEPVVRDAVVLALPYQPVCAPDCPGLCPQCGQRLADEPEHRHEERIDPRWAALAELRVEQNDREKHEE